MWGRLNPGLQGVVEEGALNVEKCRGIATLLSSPGLWMPRTGAAFPLAAPDPGNRGSIKDVV